MQRLTVFLFAAFLAACSSGTQSQSSASSAPTETSAATPIQTVAASPAATPTVSVAFTDIAGIYAEPAIRDEAALGIFGTTSGAFNPNGTIARGQFVEWLVKADDTYITDPTHQIRVAQNTTSTFVDVPPSNAYFPDVQGLANAGFVIGKNATHFAPDAPITREEMIAIKAQVDEGGPISSDPSLIQFLPFSDKNQINPQFYGAIHEDFSVRTTQNIGRVWGVIKVFHPRQPVTRAEAAGALWEVSSGSAALALGRTPPPGPH